MLKTGEVARGKDKSLKSSQQGIRLEPSPCEGAAACGQRHGCPTLLASFHEACRFPQAQFAFRSRPLERPREREKARTWESNDECEARKRFGKVTENSARAVKSAAKPLNPSLKTLPSQFPERDSRPGRQTHPLLRLLKRGIKWQASRFLGRGDWQRRRPLGGGGKQKNDGRGKKREREVGGDGIANVLKQLRPNLARGWN